MLVSHFSSKENKNKNTTQTNQPITNKQTPQTKKTTPTQKSSFSLEFLTKMYIVSCIIWGQIQEG